MSSIPLPRQFASHHLFLLSQIYANALARKSLTTYSDVAFTSIKTAGPEGNPFYSNHWLAKEYRDQQFIQTQNHPNTASSRHIPQGVVTIHNSWRLAST
jgi:hypothetical protein